MAASAAGGGGGTYDDIFGEIPPASTEFGWPLYITIPFKGDYNDGDTFGKTYYLESNEITTQLFQWTLENYVEEGYGWATEYYTYPSELYINGAKVKHMYSDDLTWWEIGFNNLYYGDYYILWCTLNQDGSIEIFLSKWG